ncbi:ATP-binding protein [Jatrophihabitans endophyticus]|uniref:ATP-binding protein n=1 Tax=Jatrophihabitans endophyticus TaxID=1206085 RepID=UPI000A0291A8|nr:ATP-binding protein [Jatrophihabitans endophyticus]
MRDARDWIREQLTELYPSIDTAVVDDAGLAVSELVTNCVRADAHELTLSMIAHRFDVVVATTDDAPGVPHRVTAPPSATSGRGLQIVEALTTEWGVSPGDGHKTVWGRFSLTDSTRCSFDCDR